MRKTPHTKALIDSEFWLSTKLEEMNTEQWEAICDGCAKCCLHKFIDDEEAGDINEQEALPTAIGKEGEEVFFTNIVCQLLHTKNCECTQYQRRSELVPHCVTLTKENLKDIFYMPSSCSYRRMHEGRGLASWHPLLNKGKKAKMHEMGISTRGRTISENDADLHAFEDYIVTWPLADLD
jgi:uncharacterized cysteine cluster protein YcgN (CxxCxxCC family)